MAIIVQVIFYIFSVIVIIQMLRFIFGGSWETQDIVVSLLMLNIMVTFSLNNRLNNNISNLNNKLFQVDKKITSHLAWHQGKDNSQKN